AQNCCRNPRGFLVHVWARAARGQARVENSKNTLDPPQMVRRLPVRCMAPRCTHPWQEERRRCSRLSRSSFVSRQCIARAQNSEVANLRSPRAQERGNQK
ncbi:unnamed protein product, partial [Ectocarpus sp. 8 AP-2014]